MKHWLWYKPDGEIGGDLTIVHSGSRTGGWPATADFNAPVMDPCLRCAEEGVLIVACQTCGGHGVLGNVPHGKNNACPDCKATGKAEVKCPECGGDGERMDPTVVLLRDQYRKRPDFGGFVSFDCSCAPEHAYRDPTGQGRWEPCACPAKKVGACRVSQGSLESKDDYQIEVDGDVVAHDTRIDMPPGETIKVRLVGQVVDGARLRVDNVSTTASVTEDPEITEYLVFEAGITNEVILRAPAQGSVGAVRFVPEKARDAPIKRLRLRGWA